MKEREETPEEFWPPKAGEVVASKTFANFSMNLWERYKGA